MGFRKPEIIGGGGGEGRSGPAMPQLKMPKILSRLLVPVVIAVVVFVGLLNSCFEYVRPYEYGIKEVKVGVNRGIQEKVYKSINDIISKRDEIAVAARENLQKELDHAETGIHIVTIEMKRTNVPGPVQPSFNEVNQATQEKEQMIYQAKEEYNKEIPAARGEADRTIKGAEGYAVDRVNRAKGDVARFVAVYKEYAKAKDITKRRLYLETLKDLFPKLGPKYIIDSDQKNILPLLNLGEQKGIIK